MSGEEAEAPPPPAAADEGEKEPARPAVNLSEFLEQLPHPPVEEYPQEEECPFPERFTGDFFRDSLGEHEFQLEQAAVGGNIQRVHRLIELGANKDAPLDKDGRTALMIACELGWMELVRNLVEVEDCDMDGPLSRAGLRAIDYAGKAQFRWPHNKPIADYLKSRGSQYTWWGAAFAGDLRRLDTFIEHGQDINEINPVLWNYNAVDCAIYSSCGKATHWLIARGGTIMVRNCHVPIVNEMAWSVGRSDTFLYKEMGLEEGDYVKY